MRHIEVRDDQGVARVKDVSFDVRAGEIVGIAGVAGNGQTELLDALSGIRRPSRGEIMVRGVRVENPAQARVQKLAHVPEDRLRMGLVQGFPAWENAILGYQVSDEYAKGGFLRRLRIIRLCRDWMAGYDVRPQEPMLEATSLSGGNQQKLVIARELEHDPDLLLVGQPTRGVDIGAIEFIHRRLVAMRDPGKAVLLVSVELDEILSLSDRILVMFDGRITGELKVDGGGREEGWAFDGGGDEGGGVRRCRA